MCSQVHCQSRTATIFGHVTNSLIRGNACNKVMLCADAMDISHGAHYIPQRVNEARRNGETVTFNRSCRNACCWYWQMQDGTKLFHVHHHDSETINELHGGVCPYCDNVFTGGETVQKK